MTQEIEQLDDETAQRAVLELWGRLAEVAVEGSQPTLADLEIVALEVEAEADGDVEAFRAHLLDEVDVAYRGEVSRLLLARLAQEPDLAPLVSASIDAADRDRLAPIPLIIGAVLLIMATVPKKLKVERSETVSADGSTSKSTKIDLETREPKEVVDALGSFVTTYAGKVIG